MKKEALNHPFAPIYDKDSRILILGTFPSVKSRANEFYYGHPQNRFWQLLAVVFRADIPQNIEEKKAFLLEHN
ncbi:MAG: DNA-deoxyinosine glycosylase, partial [Clostridiales bacterium]